MCASVSLHYKAKNKKIVKECIISQIVPHLLLVRTYAVKLQVFQVIQAQFVRVYRSKVSAGIIGHLRMIRYSYTHRKLLRSNFKL